MKYVLALIMLAGILLLIFCNSPSNTNPQEEEPDKQEELTDEMLSKFPDFITNNQDYYVTRIGSVPEINQESFTLSVSGISDSTLTFSHDDLMSLPMVEFPLTVECIGNSARGKLVSTTNWKGFNIYNFLVNLGMSDFVGGG